MCNENKGGNFPYGGQIGGKKSVNFGWSHRVPALPHEKILYEP